ncbi:ketopantoate reductase-like protein [Infundibulicybe gibba]|nr:ketopantoate reductase-like protein [Infundibulicybe gibba]
MRFHVLGLGPVGSLFSYHLRRAIPSNHSITLIHKSTSQAQQAISNGSRINVETHGLVTSADGFRSEVFEAPYNSPLASSQENSERIESLFVTTKAHQTLPAIRRLLPRLSNSSTIVLLQNGMGIYEELVHEIFRNSAQRPHFVLASNTHGAFLKGFYNVVHAGNGIVHFGIVPDPGGRDFEAGLMDTMDPQSELMPYLSNIIPAENEPSYSHYQSLRNTVAALLLMEPLNVSWKPIAEVQLAMQRKLVVNAVINPLSAIMGCRNGELFTTEYSKRITRRVCQEASDVYTAQKKAETQTWLESLPAQGVDPTTVGVGRMPRALTRASLEEEVYHVASTTKGNISSMLSDIRRGRRTEIDYINGYLLKLGSTYRVEMPATATLLNLVKMRGSIPLDQML